MTPPYPGLRPYRESESDIFRGQDEALQSLLERLNAQRFLAILGVSGCGKSSLVNAGLLANIRPRVIDRAGQPRWLIACMRPGNDPFGCLVREMESLFPRLAVRQELEADSHGLARLVRQAGLDPRQRVLVVVDQFEELFRYWRMRHSTGRKDDAAYFIKLLLETLREADSRVYFVFTMRSEFLGDCATFYGLAEQVNQGTFLLPKMTRDHMEEVITGPLEDMKVEMEPALVQLLLNETEEQEDGLPLLQHALRRTWERWLSRKQPETPISLADLQVFDSPLPFGVPLVKHHLDDHLDAIYSSFPPEQKRVVERMFRLLSERDARGRVIRRPLPFEDLDALGARDIIEAFRDESRGRTFLMPPSPEPLAGSTIDISHECLLRRWDRLRRWIDAEDRDSENFTRLADDADQASRKLVSSGTRVPLAGATLQSYLEWRKLSDPTAEWAARYEGELDATLGRPRRQFAAAIEYLEWSGQQHEVEAERATNLLLELERRKSAEAENKLTIAMLEAKRHNLTRWYSLGVLALAVAGVIFFFFQSWTFRKRNADATNNTQKVAAEIAKLQDAASKELYRLDNLDPTKRSAESDQTMRVLQGIVNGSGLAQGQNQISTRVLQGQSAIVQPSQAPSIEGWIYLGLVDTATHSQWVATSLTNMFTFSPELTPQKSIPDQLKGRKITTKTFNNLRQFSPNSSHRYGAIKTILNPGVTLQILEVGPPGKDPNGDAVWAHVSILG